MGKITRAEKKAKRKEKNLLEVKDSCVNCDKNIALDQRFCSYCGGKRIYNKLTWRNLLEDFIDRFFNLENSFIKTFVAMFRQPEDVIGGYMNGMRKKYLPAFSYFAIAITVAGFFAFVLKNYFLDEVVALSVQSPASLGMPAGSEFEQEFNNEIAETVTQYLNWVADHQTLIYIAIIPFLGLISRAVFWNYKQYNFVEHLVIYLYAYSHIAMITTTISLLFIWSPTIYQIWSFMTLPIMIFYVGWVLKRVFSLDVASLILKTVLFGVITGFLITSSFLIMVIINIRAVIQGEEVDGIFGKGLKSGFEKGKRLEQERDSLKIDSLKRLENTLEITPDMIKNRPQ